MRCHESAQKFKQFVIRVMLGAIIDNCAGSDEIIEGHNSLECALRPHPHVRRIGDVLSFQLERMPVPDIVPYVFFVGQYLVDSARASNADQDQSVVRVR